MVLLGIQHQRSIMILLDDWLPYSGQFRSVTPNSQIHPNEKKKDLMISDAGKGLVLNTLFRP
jgi:hypothetical protein